VTIHANMPAAEYHARPELNFSRLKRIEKSPFHFRHAPAETSTAFALGSATHTAILEQEHFHSRYRRQCATIRRGKEWDAELAYATNEGREILTGKDFDAAQHMADMVSSKPAARRLLLGARKELTVISTLQGVPVRCRIDFVQPGLAMGDLKSDRDLSRFSAAVERYLYLAQAAFYSDIWTEETGEKLPWKWLAVENSAPHDCAVIAAGMQDIDAGRRTYTRWMERHAECVTTGLWPGVDGGADEIDLVRPDWATNVNEMEIQDGDDDDAAF
jgi:hypothetical protein